MRDMYPPRLSTWVSPHLPASSQNFKEPVINLSLFWEGISNILNTHSTRFIGDVQRAERKLQQILFQNLNPFKLTDFVILALWTSRDQTSLDFLSRSQLVVYKHRAAHPSTTKILQVLPQYHYVVSLRSWTWIKNRASRCDCLCLTVSSCSKILGTLTISQVLSSRNRPHYTFTSKPPKTIKDGSCHYNCSWNLMLFHHFPWSGP
jgi:hypothetical protein